MDIARWWRTVFPPKGPCKAKCWFESLKKRLMRESNPWSPFYRSSMLTIRPWRFGWVGLIRACGEAACCVWMAYGLCPSHFDCLRWEGTNSRTWIAQGLKSLLFDPEVTVSNPACVPPLDVLYVPQIVTENQPWSIVTWTHKYDGHTDWWLDAITLTLVSLNRAYVDVISTHLSSSRRRGFVIKE